MKCLGKNLAVLSLVASCCWGAIAIDTTVSKDQSPASATIVAPPLSTKSGSELLLAFISTDYISGANTTVTSVSGAGLTWTLVGRTNVQRGSSEIWRALAPSTLANSTVTATLSQSVVTSMTVVALSGVDTSGSNGSGAIGAVANASAARGAPTVSLLTTRNNSFVFAVGNDFDKAVARTPAASQTLVHQYLTPTGDTYWTQMQNGPVPVSGTTVSINDTAPTSDAYNLVACEILASISSTPTWTVSGNIAPAAAASGATVKLSGTATATVTADGSGQYSFSGLANGSYTVSVSNPGYVFTPTSQSLTLNGANQTVAAFNGQPAPTWSISGSVTPAANGSGTILSLTGPSNAVATANSSGNFSFSNLADGSYTVTPSKSGYTFNPTNTQVPVSGASVSNLSFTASVAASPTLAVDVNISRDQDTASTSVTTPAFTTSSAQQLLLALISTDYLGGSNTTVKSVSGGGLTWELVGRANGQSGTSEIWRSFAPTALSNVTVAATLSQSVASTITVVTFVGADSSGLNGSGAIGAVAAASAATGAPSATLVTTRANSFVIGVGNDFDNAISRTPATSQQLFHQRLSSAGDTYWSQRTNAVVPASGTTVTINDTAPTTDRYNLAICEILAGSGTPVIAVPPTVTMNSPAPGTLAGLSTLSASASDNVGVTGVQFLIDGSPIGPQLTSSPYEFTWNSAGASNGTHSVSAMAKNSANQTTTSAAVNVTVDNTGSTAVVGSWSSPTALPAVAVNLILLANNKVLFYQDGATATVWDYLNNTFKAVPFSANLFCSAASMLADGRVFVAGGYGGSTFGIANAEIFDPATNSWTVMPNMAYKRWYPTTTTLSDGRVLVTAGWQTTAHTNAGISEIYDPATNKWTQLVNANNPFETYPFLYQLPDGRVIHIGGSEYATDTDVLDIGAQAWSVIDSRVLDGGSATMYSPGQFMKAGSAADSQNTGPSSNTTFVLDMTQPSPTWQQTASMAYSRTFGNLTMLPDGSVLATGGESDKNGGDISKAIYAAELWWPQTRTWTTMASMQTPREYHGTAILLPDGRVLESGMGADFGNVPDQKTAEFFSPPYLFKGTRPTITNAPSELHYSASFAVTTPDAANITKVSLIRTGAVTHFFDQNERYIPLNFQLGSGNLTVTAPANANIAPPGYYMLFIVNSAGVPSIAPFVHFAGN
ncbi:MAG: galactose oxidase-like domain-containing protein [Bryobacteraceae bacterium]